MYTIEESKIVELSTNVSKNIFDALVLSYQAKLSQAKANLEIYFTNPAGIGEHSDILAEFDVHLATIADADGKLYALEQHFAKAQKQGVING